MAKTKKAKKTNGTAANLGFGLISRNNVLGQSPRASVALLEEEGE